MTDLERSHAELRGALILAGKRIRKLDRDLNLARHAGHGSLGAVPNDPVLLILRRVLRDARAIAKRQGITVRVRLAPKEK